MTLNYQHYSFDLWETLLKSNPDFKKERVEYFHKKHNPHSFPGYNISEIISEVSIQCDAINQAAGGSIDALEMYAMVLYRLGHNMTEWNTEKLQVLYDNIEQIFFEFPPRLYSVDTDIYLRHITRMGKTFSIMSNTGFVKGLTIQSVIPDTVLNNSSFWIFSDQVDASKPSSKIFDILISEASHLTLPEGIIHIGDNGIADYGGAKNAGLSAAIINQYNITIKDVL